MTRTFKFVALTTPGTPQPVFGTTTTGAVVPAANVGGTGENYASNTVVSIPVTDSSFFQKGDPILVDSGANEEPARVYSVPDGTHVVVANLTLPHASGVYIRLAIPASVVYIQTIDGNTSPIFIGNKFNMAKATGTFCIKKLLQVAAAAIPTDLTLSVGGGFAGPFNLGEFWFDGTTAADKIMPSAWND